jgi:hypothetical protein
VKEKFAIGRDVDTYSSKGWHLSHTGHRNRRESRMAAVPWKGLAESAAHRSTVFAHSTYPSSLEPAPSSKKAASSNKTGPLCGMEGRVFRAHPDLDAREIPKPRDQVASGFPCFLGLRALTLVLAPAGLRAVTGAMLSGWPAGAAAASSGLGLKYTRQPGESCALFLTMQAVTRSTSGISGPQSRNASPLQAASSSWV